MAKKDPADAGSHRLRLPNLSATLTGDRWFQATLADAYFGFLTYKEPGWLARIVWLVAILLLGNVAMAKYCLIQLLRIPATAGLLDVSLAQDKRHD